MHPLERKITGSILQDHINNGDKIVLGVSGGPDSVALLLLLLPLQPEHNISLIAVYVDHGLRPDETVGEKMLVKSLCDKMGVSFETEEVDVVGHAKREKKSLEHAARDLRYEALRKYKQKHGASLIAVAHTADDQAEEVLIRLLRGSGGKGLSGMAVRSGDIIRPLLMVEKTSLISYLREKQITYCRDSTNDDMRFLRNRVRHILLPFLEKEFDPGIRNALRKTAESLARDEEYLDSVADKAMDEVLIPRKGRQDHAEQRIERSSFSRLPSAIQRRVIEKILWRTGCPAKYDYIIKIVEAGLHGTTGTEIHLSRGLRVGIQRSFMEFVYPKGRTSWRGRLYDEEE